MVFPQLTLTRTIFRFLNPKYVANDVKLKRGQFDPYKLYPAAFVWNPYKDENGTTKVDPNGVKFYYKQYRHQELGLLYEDCVNEELPTVTEAVARLPKDVLEARKLRIDRAIMLLTAKKTLPKEEQTTPEQDVPYLSPYITWVENEAAEYDNFIAETEDIAVPPGKTTQLADYDMHSGSRRIHKVRYNDAHDHGYKISKSTSGHWWH